VIILLFNKLKTYGVALSVIPMVVLAFMRAHESDRSFGGYTGCTGCFLLPTLQHDAWLIGFAFGVCALVYYVRSYITKIILSSLILTLLVAFCVDFIILKTLSNRLYIFDFIKFISDPGSIVSFTKSILKFDSNFFVILIGVLGIILIVFSLYFPQSLKHNTLSRICLLLALLWVSVAMSMPSGNMRYVHSQSMGNLFEINYNNGLYDTYSSTFESKLEKTIRPRQRICEKGLNEKPNIILVVVESLSAYQSRLLGGPFHLTPKLDEIARKNSYFTEFVANGFTTDHGIIAFINGRLPTEPSELNTKIIYNGFDDAHNSVMDVLHQTGYTTHFFGAFDLNFINTKKWLEKVGFDNFEGSENHFYNSWDRGQFNSAPDKALFLRTLSWVDNRDKTLEPFFALLLTISSHPPFIHPESKKYSEADVFHYVDEQISDFYNELYDRGFFENGILLISGDHRSMTPLHSKEYEKYKDKAFSRIPLIAIGQTHLPPGAIAGNFQQTDLLPSLNYLTNATACYHSGQGIFFRSDPQPASYALHQRGDQRNRVDIYFGLKQGSLFLSADRSYWMGNLPPEWESIADWIHADRIARTSRGVSMRAKLEQLWVEENQRPSP